MDNKGFFFFLHFTIGAVFARESMPEL